MPTFQTIESGITINSTPIYTQTINNTITTNNSDSVSLQTPPTTEIKTVSPAPPAGTSSGTLHSILMNNHTAINSNISASTSSSTFSATHNLVNASVSNNVPKASQSTTSANQTSSNINDKILTRTRLQDLVKEIDPSEQLDEEVEDLLLQLVDEFVTSTVNNACIFAKHRNASTVEVKDVQLYLEKMYNMWIPGFGTEEVKPYKKPPVTEAHKQRLALIRKSLRKY